MVGDGDTFSVLSQTVSTSGNTTLITPTSGRRVRLFYVLMNADGANAADVTSAVRFGASGSLVYPVCLKAGSIFARNIGAGRRYVQGAINEALIANLSAAQTVNLTVEWEEVD